MSAYYYEAKTTGKKMGLAAALAAVLALLGGYANSYLSSPETFTFTPDMGEALMSALIGLAYACYAGWRNWSKNKDKPRRMRGISRMLAVCIVGALVSGCMTMPSLAGKTTAKTTFEDRVDAVADPVTGAITTPGQTTRYTRDVKLPAGVELAGNDGMAYRWTPEGGGDIAINQAGQANSVEQANVIASGLQLQGAAFGSLLQAVGALAQLAAPIVSQHLEQQGALDLYRAQNPKADPIKEAVASALTGALQQGTAQGDTFREMIRQIIEAELARRGAGTQPGN